MTYAIGVVRYKKMHIDIVIILKLWYLKKMHTDIILKLRIT